MQLGSSKVSGRMDDVEIAVLLCDVCDEEFDSIQTVDPERNIIPVETVKEAMEVLKSQPFDLVLLDINLPDGDGYAIAKTYRKKYSDTIESF